jgi:hypothetical protein
LRLEDPVTPRNLRQTFENQTRKSDAQGASLDASLTLRDILLKVGEEGAGGANGTFDFDLLGMCSTASPCLSFRSPTFLVAPFESIPRIVNVFAPFRLPTVADLDMNYRRIRSRGRRGRGRSV